MVEEEELEEVVELDIDGEVFVEGSFESFRKSSAFWRPVPPGGLSEVVFKGAEGAVGEEPGIVFLDEGCEAFFDGGI